MAEVKTYKCDICGQVYHVDENVEHGVMDLTDVTSGDVEHYKHICNKCAGVIRRVVKDPNFIGKLLESQNETVRDKRKYADLLTRIIRKITGEPLIYYHFANYEQETDEAIIKLGELEKSRDDWKCAASWGIAMSLAFMVAWVIQLFA